MGPTEKSFELPDMDPTCGARRGYSLDAGDLYYYHTHQVKVAAAEHGETIAEHDDTDSVNEGSIAEAAINCALLDVRKKGK
jgi:hypothetical protein